MVVVLGVTNAAESPELLDMLLAAGDHVAAGDGHGGSDNVTGGAGKDSGTGGHRSGNGMACGDGRESATATAALLNGVWHIRPPSAEQKQLGDELRRTIGAHEKNRGKDYWSHDSDRSKALRQLYVDYLRFQCQNGNDCASMAVAPIDKPSQAGPPLLDGDSPRLTQCMYSPLHRCTLITSVNALCVLQVIAPLPVPSIWVARRPSAFYSSAAQTPHARPGAIWRFK